MQKQITLTVQETHINKITIGDKVLRHGQIAVITQAGYNRLYGYYLGDENNPHLLEQRDCTLDKIVFDNSPF